MYRSKNFSFLFNGFQVIDGFINGIQFFLISCSKVFSAAEKKAIPEPTSFVTEHRARFNGQSLDYTVTAGETYVRDKDGDPKASIFAFAYTKNDVADDEVRPVTFLWNGGPGSAS